VSSDRPIFIVGCPRSGTTLLSLMVHAHPRLAMPPETRFLIRTWRHRKQFGDLTDPANHLELARYCVRTGSKVREMGLDPQEIVDNIMLAPPTIGTAFGTIFKMFADAHGAARWGDKRPQYYSEVDVLLRLFPDAQIVHVVRDGRANVESLNRMPWWPYDSLTSMATWSQAEFCSRRNARRLPKDVFHVLRYESLVADPQTVLRELCAFLEEDFDPVMLEPHQVVDVVPERKTWHENLKGSISTDRVESWRTGLEPWEIGLMETVFRRKLKRWGYSISGDGTLPSPKLVAKYVKESFERRSAMRTRWSQESREALEATYPVAAQLTSAQIALAESQA
jgi:hypothetical protein